MAHIALLARMHWPVLKEPLGFVRDHPPRATTISRTLAGVPYEQLQGALTGWVGQEVVGQEVVDREVVDQVVVDREVVDQEVVGQVVVDQVVVGQVVVD